MKSDVLLIAVIRKIVIYDFRCYWIIQDILSNCQLSWYSELTDYVIIRSKITLVPVCRLQYFWEYNYFVSELSLASEHHTTISIRFTAQISSVILTHNNCGIIFLLLIIKIHKYLYFHFTFTLFAVIALCANFVPIARSEKYFQLSSVQIIIYLFSNHCIAKSSKLLISLLGIKHSHCGEILGEVVSSDKTTKEV